MSIMIFIMSFVCISSLTLGVISVLHRESRSEASITFFFLCFANAVMCLGYANVLDNDSFSSIIFFRCLIIMGLISTVLIATYLIMILSENKTKPHLYILAFFTLTGIIVGVLASSGDNIVLTNEEANTISYTFNHGLGIYGVAANTFFASFFTAYLLWKWRKSAVMTRDKNLSRAFSTVYTLVAASIILVVLIPVTGIAMPPLSGIFVYVFIVFVYIISKRYKALTISFENISGFIYSDVIIPIVVSDKKGRVALVNKAATSFFELDENTLYKTHINDLILISETSTSSIVGDVHESLGFEAKTADGKHIVHVVKSDNRDRHGDLLCSLYMFKDTTETKQLIRHLNEAVIEAEIANKAKSSFLANISHEIRTPMNAIIGMAEIALQNNNNPEINSHLQSIRSAGQSLVTIINDILDFSKIESGKMEIAEREYLLTSVVVDIVNMFAIKLAHSDVLLLVDINPRIPVHLIGDETRVKQILVNIIGNAVKFTHEGFIKLEIDGAYVVGSEDEYFLEFKVTDTGIGIKNEDISKLFTSFSQVDTRKNRDVKGTGLGLSITRNLCHMMQGDIEVESTYGSGSIFTVNIKQKAKDSKEMLAQVEDPSDKCVAFYEPDNVLRAHFVKMLSSLGVRHLACATMADYLNSLENLAITHTTVRTELMSRELEDAVLLPNSSVKLILVSNYYDKPNTSFQCSEVYLPFYSFQVADILNNRESVIMTKERGEDYTVTPLPDARILIVDDTYVNLQVAQGLLAPYGMTIDTALSGREAIALVKQHDYDLIFMDHMMPEMDGVDATHIIRQMGGTYEQLTIVALTANALTGAREMFMREGFDDFIAKPIEISKLTGVIKKWLVKKQGRRFELESPSSALEEVSSAACTKEIQQSEKYLLNMQKGLEILGNNEQLFFSILHTFVLELDVKLAALTTAYEQGDLRTYGITAHSLKSSSQSVGVETLPDLALALENASREENREFVAQHHQRLLDCVDALKLELTQRFKNELLASSQANGQKVNTSPHLITQSRIDKQLLKELFDAVDLCDPKESRSILERIRLESYPAQQEEFLEELSRYIEQSNFMEAEDLLRKYAGVTSQRNEETEFTRHP